MARSQPLLLRNSAFARVWLTQVLSQSGIRMYQIAVVWWIVQSQGPLAGRWLALFAILSALPPVIFATWIGEKIDRGSPRLLMMGSDFISALTVLISFVMFNFGVPSVGVLAILGFFLSLSQSFFDPALNRSIRGLVGSDDLSGAISYTASTASFANLFGAVVSATLIDALGVDHVPLVTAVGYFISGTMLFLTPFKEVRVEDETAARSVKASERRLDPSFFKFLFLNTAVVNFFSVPIVILLPLITDRVLMGSSSILAGLEASLFAGFILGSLSSGWSAGKNAISVSIASLCLMGASYHVVAFGKSTEMVAIGLLLAGVCVGLNNARMMSFFHEILPENEKGKFFSKLNAYCNIAVPLGYGLFGAAADMLPLRWILVLEGIGIALTALWLLKIGQSAEKISEPQEAL